MSRRSIARMLPPRALAAGVLGIALTLTAAPVSAAPAPVLPLASTASPAPAGISAAATSSLITRTPKGLLRERLRNTRARFAARFVYIPGVPKFNRLVDHELRAAIHLSKQSYRPQAFPRGAGLGDRGCVADSTKWSAKRVLARAATAPPGKRGAAVTCEVRSASGSVIQVAMRTVRGSQRRVVHDTTRLYYADVKTGAAGRVLKSKLWHSFAPKSLWTVTVKRLIAASGAEVPASLADPSPSQLRIATHALIHSTRTSSGGIWADLGAGITSPELRALGIAKTKEATPVRVSHATADRWSRKLGVLLRHSAGKRFVGVKQPVSKVQLDCRLLPCVALTYDDGPGPYTARLLRTLRAKHARATFFMVGSRVPGNEAILRRAVKDGHELGSHTMDHADLTMRSLSSARSDVRRAAKAITAASHREVRLFRPPYGAIDDRIIRAVDMPAILWSVDTNDWREPGRAALIERSVPVVDPGGIILFHDIHVDSVAVAGRVVLGLRDRGFELVTVSQLFDGKVPLGRIAARY